MRGGSSTTAKSAAAAEAVPVLNMFLLLYAAIEIGGWLYCSQQQLVTTHDSVVGILQGGVLIPSNMTAQQLFTFMQGNMDKDNRIAWTIAWVTQIIYWGAALPGTPLHSNVWLHRAIIGLFFLLEVTTDLWYSIATNTTLGGAFTWIFNFGNGGWLVSLIYIAAMSAGSMFLGIRGFNLLGRVLAPAFRQSAAARAA